MDFGRRGVLLHLSGSPLWFPLSYHRRVAATKLTTSKPSYPVFIISFLSPFAKYLPGRIYVNHSPNIPQSARLFASPLGSPSGRAAIRRWHHAVTERFCRTTYRLLFIGRSLGAALSCRACPSFQTVHRTVLKIHPVPSALRLGISLHCDGATRTLSWTCDFLEKIE